MHLIFSYLSRSVNSDAVILTESALQNEFHQIDESLVLGDLRGLCTQVKVGNFEEGFLKTPLKISPGARFELATNGLTVNSTPTIHD